MVVHDDADAELVRGLAREGHDVLDVVAGPGAARLIGVFELEMIVVAVTGGGDVCRELRQIAPARRDHRARAGRRRRRAGQLT